MPDVDGLAHIELANGKLGICHLRASSDVIWEAKGLDENDVSTGN
jgi:hypothetical protein